MSSRDLRSVSAPVGVEPLEPDKALEQDSWIGVELRGAVLTGARLDRFRISNSVLIGCELSGTNLAEADLWRVELRDCRMSGVILEAARLRDVRITGCKLDTASLRGSKAERIELDDCVLREADLSAATWKDAAILDCDLTGAVFTSARLAGTRLHRSTLDRVVGADSLRGVVIDPAQALSLGLQLLDAMGIVTDHDPDDE